MSKRGAAILACLLASTAFQVQASDLITNGGFENPSLGYGWTANAVPGSAEVHFDGIAYYHACCLVFGTYPGGNNAAFFGAWDNNGGAIWQDIATVAGQSYTLSFLYGSIILIRPQSMHVNVLNGGDSLASMTVTATGTTGAWEMTQLDTMMSPYSLAFVAQSSTTRIAFMDQNLHSSELVDGVLDNVSVAAVPEPGTYALMLAGLGLVGAMVRRKRAGHSG